MPAARAMTTRPAQAVRDVPEMPRDAAGAVLRRALELLRDRLDPADEAPTKAACAAARRALRQSNCGSTTPSGETPAPTISSMGTGDLILEWRGAGKRVILFVLPTGASRLQQLTGSGATAKAAEVARNPTREQLLESLAWLRV